MSTYSQWVKTYRDVSPARVYYVHGGVSVLIEDTLDKLRERLQPSPIDSFLFLPGESKDIWTAAFTFPIDPEASRLIIVRNAEEFEDWAPLHSWLVNRHPNCYMIFVSSEAELKPIFVKGKKVGFPQHIEILKSRGKIIKCSQPSDEDLSSFLTEAEGYTRGSAKYLINRSSGDVAEIMNFVRKIRVFRVNPDKQLIDLLVDEKALDSFEDYLLTRNKPAALLAAKNLSEYDIKGLVDRLDRRLSFLYDLGICVRRKMYTPDIASTLGVSPYLVKLYSPIVKEYDEKRIYACRQALATVEVELAAGRSKSVLESLIALW